MVWVVRILAKYGTLSCQNKNYGTLKHVDYQRSSVQIHQTHRERLSWGTFECFAKSEPYSACLGQDWHLAPDSKCGASV